MTTANNEPIQFTVYATNKAGVPDLADDVYSFTVSDIRKAQGGNAQYDKGFPRAEFVLQLDRAGTDGKPVIVRDWITIYPEPGPATKLYQLASALLNNGQPLQDGHHVSNHQLLGKRGRLLWGNKEKGNGKGVVKYLPPQ
jgi:hypothetical protein